RSSRLRTHPPLRRIRQATARPRRAGRKSWRPSLPLPRGDDLVEALRRHAAVELAVDHHRGRAGAVAETVDRLERECAVRGRLMKADAELRLRVRLERPPVHRLTGFGAAEVNRGPAWRALPHEIVEDDH